VIKVKAGYPAYLGNISLFPEEKELLIELSDFRVSQEITENTGFYNGHKFTYTEIHLDDLETEEEIKCELDVSHLDSSFYSNKWSLCLCYKILKVDIFIESPY